MSWSNTYTHTIAIGVDMLTASVLWNRSDVTVSSLCGLELLKPSGVWSLRALGRLLNKLQANHCELAIQADILRAQRALRLLTASDGRYAA